MESSVLDAFCPTLNNVLSLQEGLAEDDPLLTRKAREYLLSRTTFNLEAMNPHPTMNNTIFNKVLAHALAVCPDSTLYIPLLPGYYELNKAIYHVHKAAGGTSPFRVAWGNCENSEFFVQPFLDPDTLMYMLSPSDFLKEISGSDGIFDVDLAKFNFHEDDLMNEQIKLSFRVLYSCKSDDVILSTFSWLKMNAPKYCKYVPCFPQSSQLIAHAFKGDSETFSSEDFYAFISAMMSCRMDFDPKEILELLNRVTRLDWDEMDENERQQLKECIEGQSHYFIILIIAGAEESVLLDIIRYYLQPSLDTCFLATSLGCSDTVQLALFQKFIVFGDDTEPVSICLKFKFSLEVLPIVFEAQTWTDNYFPQILVNPLEIFSSLNEHIKNTKLSDDDLKSLLKMCVEYFAVCKEVVDFDFFFASRPVHWFLINLKCPNLFHEELFLDYIRRKVKLTSDLLIRIMEANPTKLNPQSFLSKANSSRIAAIALADNTVEIVKFIVYLTSKGVTVRDCLEQLSGDFAGPMSQIFTEIYETMHLPSCPIKVFLAIYFTKHAYILEAQTVQRTTNEYNFFYKSVLEFASQLRKEVIERKVKEIREFDQYHPALSPLRSLLK